MKDCFFASDIHGDTERYKKLFRLIEAERPPAVFLGGDILPGAVMMLSSGFQDADFVNDFLFHGFSELKKRMGGKYPRVFLILGNDDGRFQEAAVMDAASRGAWEYAHARSIPFEGITVYGYSYVPPTPFRLKDWERYDVSRYADPGCIHPEDGVHTIPVSESELRYATIREDLELLADGDDLSRAIFLFHSPPYGTSLDRAALDGKTVDHVPLDVHVGSMAIKRFIEKRQPLATLHGHIHESVRLTGSWKEVYGTTTILGAAHDGPELALIRFNPGKPSDARRELV